MQFPSIGRSVYFFRFFITFWSLIVWLQCDFFIMALDGFWHVIHAIVADLLLKILWSLWLLGKSFVTIWRHFFAMFVETDLWKDGLNHIMFHFPVWFFWFVVVVFQMNIITWLLVHLLFNFCYIKNFLEEEVTAWWFVVGSSTISGCKADYR